MADWVTGDDVARRLGALGHTSVDPDRLDTAAAAACRMVRGRRGRTLDDELGLDPAVWEGTVRWACLVVQAPSQPTGFFQDPGVDTVYGDTLRDIYGLVGYDPVLA